MIDFPASPTVGQSFTAAGVTWIWDGAKWTASGSAASVSGIVNVTAPYSRGGAARETHPMLGTATFGTQSFSANLLQIVPVYLAGPRSLSSLGLQVSGTGSGNMRIGVYASAVDGGPGVLLWDSGNLNTATNGLKTGNPGLTGLKGWYWLAWTLSIATTITSIPAASLLVGIAAQWPASPIAPGLYLQQAFTFGALPTDLTATSFTPNVYTGQFPVFSWTA
jgi:hypothetical protein